MDKKFKSVFEYKVIYIFTINDETHKDFVKIGDATIYTNSPIDSLHPNCRELNQAALKRIKSYTNTAGIKPILLHTEVAVKTIKNADGSISLKAFRDYEVHKVLKNSNIKNTKIGDSTGKEWFKIDLETALKAIEAVKKDYANLSNSKNVKFTPIIFRPEQEKAIEKTIKQFKKSDRMLWNAKMRFGKTICALEVIRKMKFKKSIIITHRPVVNSGWYEDFQKVFYKEKNYIYGSKTNGYSIEKLIESGNNFVYFASIQDLRGSIYVGGKFDKNEVIFDTLWDCVIVDEAHEGTTTALGDDTVKAVVKEGKGTKFLALSGTPFNILTDFNEDSIYTWDYIMEQESKNEWDKLHFGDSNPYDELPELKIYTYSLENIIANKTYITFEDKAFNFQEFFRTWTGDIEIDYENIPKKAHIGDFVHESDVWSFLNLMTKEDKDSCYPFANEEYRNLFKHSLWIVPGVKEARALKKLMLKHKIFGNGMFEIVNVAGNGDEEDKTEEALSKVQNAIKSAGDENYTITLSCGKLTTGVTVREWTAVFMLAGSYSTSASNYLQTIFRVQSPCNKNGRIKQTSYVFDFAPDRTLKMVSTAVAVSSKAGKTSLEDKQIMGKFLNYCPVISVSGSEMEEYTARKLLQQLKKAYAEKVVKNGFDDKNLYSDELLKLQAVDIKKFDELKAIIGSSKASVNSMDITLNNQGLTNEEYDEKEKLEKKRKKDLTPEEKARLQELKKAKQLRNDAISILRSISIRMPLLIYGANLPYDEEINLDKFIEIVDDSSWKEFMPNGITKEKFKEFQKYYDEEVFIAAGRRIRDIAKNADSLEPTERVKKIASLFSYFKNPDKETVLTPWRVVNMHMSDMLGGWCFYNEKFDELLDKPRFCDRGIVTKKVFNKKSKLMEINSKTGLYPLYLVYSLYQQYITSSKKDFSKKEKFEIWKKVIENNIFIICKTPMARTITKRTLLGFQSGKINAHCFDNIINQFQNKSDQVITKLTKSKFWNLKGDVRVKFDAIVGNPPYQENISSGTNSSLSKQLFPSFIIASIKMEPDYISLITPSRWFTGNAQDKSFLKLREFLIENQHFEKIYNYFNNKDIFPGVTIGSINYFLYNKNYEGNVEFYEISGSEKTMMERPLFEEGLDIVISMNNIVSILNKVKNFYTFKSMMEITQGRNAFGIVGKTSELEKITKEKMFKGAIPVRCAYEQIRYIEKNFISKNIEIMKSWKIFTSKGNGGAGLLTDNKQVAILGKSFIGEKNSVCTDSLIPIGCFETEIEAINLQKYMCTKFLRFMVGICKVSQNLYQNVYRFVPIQDFSNRSDINWNKNISEIDKQLYQKYGLTEKEIDLIENKIKAME